MILALRTIKTSSKRSHITSPRFILAAIIRSFISSALNPFRKRPDSELVVVRNTNSGRQAAGWGGDYAGFFI